MLKEKEEYQTATIAEMTNGIVLSNFKKSTNQASSYQSEAELENQLLDNLVSLGYEKLNIKSVDDLDLNLKKQIEKLNNLNFSESEWQRFNQEYLNSPNDGIVEKTKKIQEDYIYQFKFDDGHYENIKIIDKKNIHKNRLQVVNQITAEGEYKNRYDVTILVNGLPLVHIELKKRGVNLHEAFNQIHRYSRESFNLTNSLYKYVQIFVISNGTYTKYFANTETREKKSYEFACDWSDAKNNKISDLVDFTKTFFEKRVILEILTKYCVFDANNTLLVMRPYQIAATECILWKINSSHENKKAGKPDAGGYIWHTTGSGKTLTSFKTARLATELPYIDKVFFVVDRKDLDYQTIKEYQKFEQDSVNGSKDTKELKKNIEKNDNKIVVTTIQKLNEFIKRNPKHEIYGKECVLIFDECHRSQFGEAQKNIRTAFKKYYQFGFTGTPIFVENSLKGETTAGTFGAQLHSYVITDAIRDGKVLKFKVDYNNVKPDFKTAETEKNEEVLKELENSKMFLHPDRIHEISKHILKVFNTKTHRNEYVNLNEKRKHGFNAMFAVQSIEAAKLYYKELNRLQNETPDKKLKIATIFSFNPNEESKVIGEIADEAIGISALNSTAKEFLSKVISDYNHNFNANYALNDNDFQNYYKDLSQRVKESQVDLLIVVGMFLTGFDAPKLNTLFVDKNLRYHGLIKAFSRTNRILNEIKTFGNIVCFRDLEDATKEAIKTFGDENSTKIILEKSFDEYINGFNDTDSGEAKKGYIEICKELLKRFPEPTEIALEVDKKAFVHLFSELIKTENILKNFDEFGTFKKIITDRQMQDMKSTYVDIREEILKNRKTESRENNQIDYSDVEFQIALLKTDEINLDYILNLILEKAKENKDLASIKAETSRLIKSTVDNRAKETLVLDFIESTDLLKLNNKDDIITAFYTFANKAKEVEINRLIDEENLKVGAERIINVAIEKGYFERSGDTLDHIIPPASRIGGKREKIKNNVLVKINRIAEIFTGI